MSLLRLPTHPFAYAPVNPTPSVSLDIVAGRSFELYVQVYLLDRLTDTSGWDVTVTIKRTINGDVVMQYDQDDGPLGWSAAQTAWRLRLTPTQSATLAPVAAGPGPRPFELMLYDVLMDPGDTWALPHIDPQPFLAMGGQCRIFPSG